MRLASLLLPALALTTSLALAQKVTSLPPLSLDPPAAKLVSPAAGCPVSLSAEQQSHGSLLAANTRSGQGSVQALRVTLQNHGLVDITALDLELRGTSPRGRTMRLLPDAANAVRRIHLNRKVRPSDSTVSDLTLDNLSSVSRLAITSVTYTDGTQWRSHSFDQCAVAPDPFMLVAQLP